jgi:DNA-binding response OmpR family regulator
VSYILIAEDDEDIMTLMVRKLELSGYDHIFSTGDGQVALDHALSNPPRLLILDIMLPNLDGLTICASVKQHYGESAPPVIITSARGQRAHLEEGKEAGADIYMVKPFTPNDLLRKVDALLA